MTVLVTGAAGFIAVLERALGRKAIVELAPIVLDSRDRAQLRVKG